MLEAYYLEQGIRHALMRIACYALVEKDAGSVASANYFLVDELLRRGHTIDFYAIKGWVEPREFEGYPTYRYLGVCSAQVARLWRVVPEPLRGAIAALLSMSYAHRPHIEKIERVARRITQANPMMCSSSSASRRYSAYPGCRW